MFVRQSWYVFGWVTDDDGAGLQGKVIIYEPVVVWRSDEGKVMSSTTGGKLTDLADKAGVTNYDRP